MKRAFIEANARAESLAVHLETHTSATTPACPKPTTLPLINFDFTRPPVSGKWRSTTSAHETTIPANAEVTTDYVTFKGEAATVPLATNPNAMAATTYVIRLRIHEQPRNKGWVMSPDYVCTIPSQGRQLKRWGRQLKTEDMLQKRTRDST